MSEQENKSIHREFELERIILFSDAVFAIAITLLIIEIKFPEVPEGFKMSGDLLKLFSPTLIQFSAFILSFAFIGMSWARHLKMFRYLRTYDNGVIVRNLISLFFIVSFPFSASGLTHMKPLFMFPIFIYLGNVMLMFFSNFLLAHYVFKSKPSLSTQGHEAEKNYIYLHAKYFAFVFLFSFILISVTGILSNFNVLIFNISVYVMIIMMLIMRRKLKKYKPKNIPNFGA